MRIERDRRNKSHGDGAFTRGDFRKIGENVIFEYGVLVFHPENIEIEDDVYIGHYTILKGYYKNTIKIGAHTWIGQFCFLHGAGGLEIGKAVGIGPRVTILTSEHELGMLEIPVYYAPIKFEKVVIEDGADIGAGAIILPGVRIGEGAVIGAGAVVTEDVPPYEVWAGVPARKIKRR